MALTPERLRRQERFIYQMLTKTISLTNPAYEPVAPFEPPEPLTIRQWIVNEALGGAKREYELELERGYLFTGYSNAIGIVLGRIPIHYRVEPSLALKVGVFDKELVPEKPDTETLKRVEECRYQPAAGFVEMFIHPEIGLSAASNVSICHDMRDWHYPQLSTRQGQAEWLMHVRTAMFAVHSLKDVERFRFS